MNLQAWRVAAMLLLCVVAVWAGARMYAVRTAANSRAARPVPASSDDTRALNVFDAGVAAGSSDASAVKSRAAGVPVNSDRVSAANSLGTGVLVPAGEASPPNSVDLAAADGAAPPAAKIPDRLPDFSLNDLSGKSKSIMTWRGTSLVLNFWATWCAPCRHEIPLLEALAGEWAGRGVAVIGIAVDYPEKVQAYAKQLKISYPLLIGEQDALDVAADFGVASPAFPFTVFTDRRGEVVALYMGELHRAEAGLILSIVQNLNDGTLELPAARQKITQGLRTLRSRQPV